MLQTRPANPGAGRRHQVGLITPPAPAMALPDVEFHGRRGNAHHPVHRHEPEGGDNTAFIDEVALVAAKTRSPTAVSMRRHGREHLPVRAQRFAWQFSGSAGRERQWQRLHLRQSQRPQRRTRSPSSEQRQHEPVRLPGCRHVQPLVPGRPARQLPDPEPANPGAGRRHARSVVASVTPASTTLHSVPDVEFHGRGRRCTPSSSSA